MMFGTTIYVTFKSKNVHLLQSILWQFFSRIIFTNTTFSSYLKNNFVKIYINKTKSEFKDVEMSIL